jgi:hypothetical protein
MNRTFENFLDHFDLTHQQVADLAGVDLVSVDKFANDALLPPPQEAIVVHDRITRAIFRILIQHYPGIFWRAAARLNRLSQK